jgi:rhamnosyltransferase
MNPKFAILLAAYNGSNFIKDQIDSILEQSNVELQLFISVDKSDDGTEEIVKYYQERDSRVHLLPLGMRFGGAGPNFYRLIMDVNLNEFNFVAFSDQDDLWNADKLYKSYLSMKKNNADAYSSGFTAFWPNGKKKFFNKTGVKKKWDYFFESAGPGCTYVISKNLAINLQKFISNINKSILNEIEFHDWLIYAYSRFNNYSWIIDSASTMLYRQHLTNQLGVNYGIKALRHRISSVVNGYAVSQTLFIAHAIGAMDLPLIKGGLLRGRFGFVFLSAHFWECRRTFTHRIFFFISCVVFAILNPNIDIHSK